MCTREWSRPAGSKARGKGIEMGNLPPTTSKHQLITGQYIIELINQHLCTLQFPVDPVELKESSFLKRLEAELEANLTDKQRYDKRMGFKESDFTETSQSIGGVECILFGCVVALVVGLDLPDFKREWGRLKRNLNCDSRPDDEDGQNPDDGPDDITTADDVNMLWA